MWPFKRKPKGPKVAPEIEELYRAERRDRMGVAWLLGIGTLIVTVLIAAALFYGGRWLWNKLGDIGDNPTETAQTDQGAQNPPSESPAPTPAPSTTPTPEPNPTPTPNPNTSPTPPPTTTPTPTPSTTPTPAPGSAATPPTTPTPSPATPTPSTTPTPNSASSSSIPNTGPGDTVAIFFAVAILGTLSHYYFVGKRS